MITGAMVRILQLSCLVMLASIFTYSQAQEQASVTFALDFPGSVPEHYSIRVQSDGKAHYESSGKFFPDSEERDSFALECNVSSATRQKIFDLAAKAGYFQKDLDSHRKNMAFTGKKTLAYKDAQRSAESTYNFPSDPAVQELTDVFQNLSATLELGHRLDYDRRYQKLALDEELKRAEEMARTTPLVELQAIVSVLQQIIDDPGVINVSRARAQRLLQQLGGR